MWLELPRATSFLNELDLAGWPITEVRLVDDVGLLQY